MKFDYENAPRIACTKCGRKYVILPDNVTEDPYVCYRCKQDAKHEKEKVRITSPDCYPDYEPFSTDDGYYCPYCGVFINIDDDYEMYADGGHNVTCPCCNKPFEVETYVSYSFTSKKGDCT